MRLSGHVGSNPMPSAYGSMVKWTSSLGSNEVFRVRLLVGLLTKRLKTEGLPRPTLASVPATGAGWKPVELCGLEGSTPTGVSDPPTAGSDYIVLGSRCPSQIFVGASCNTWPNCLPGLHHTKPRVSRQQLRWALKNKRSTADWSTWLITRGSWVRIPPAPLVT